MLVVDDSHTILHIEKIILEAENYNVSTSVDGIYALENMKQFKIDLVVTDVNMPHIDGFALLYNMRHEDELKNILVIMASSMLESVTLDKAKNFWGSVQTEIYFTIIFLIGFLPHRLVFPAFLIIIILSLSLTSY